MSLFNFFKYNKVKSQETNTERIREFQIDKSILDNIKDEYKKARIMAEESLKIIQNEHPNIEFEIIYKGKKDSNYDFLISSIPDEFLLNDDELSWEDIKDMEILELGKLNYSEIFKAQVVDVFIKIDNLGIGRDLRKSEVLTYLKNFINQVPQDMIIVDESEDIIMRNNYKTYSFILATNSSTVLIKRSRTINQSIKDGVWNRDGGKCVICGSNERIEFDHIIPFSKGGSNTYRNIQILCEICNRSKSAKIG